MDASGAPGGTQSLSNAQFGATPLPTAHGAVAREPRPPQAQGAVPLSNMASTYGTVKSTATWRKPGTVLPYTSATSGSVFNPFGP